MRGFNFKPVQMICEIKDFRVTSPTERRFSGNTMPVDVRGRRPPAAHTTDLWPQDGDRGKLPPPAFPDLSRTRRPAETHPEFRGVPAWQRSAPAHKSVSAGWWLLLRSERARSARNRVAAAESVRPRSDRPRRHRRRHHHHSSRSSGHRRGVRGKKADRTRRSHVRRGHRPGFPELLHRGGAKRRHRDHRQRVQRPLHPVSTAAGRPASRSNRRSGPRLGPLPREGYRPPSPPLRASLPATPSLPASLPQRLLRATEGKLKRAPPSRRHLHRGGLFTWRPRGFPSRHLSSSPPVPSRAPPRRARTISPPPP